MRAELLCYELVELVEELDGGEGQDIIAVLVRYYLVVSV